MAAERISDPAQGGTLTWVIVIALALIGIGLVLPSGGSDAPPQPVKQLIGPPTGDVLVIPALKVKAPLVSVAMNSQAVLTPPRNPRQVGYWGRSARPGSTTGQTLITGHTVHTGGGALDKLSNLRAGQKVTVYRKQDGEQTTAPYRITAVRTYSKDLLAKDAQELFGQSGGHGRLVLVTCTGWDGKEYHGNVVVFARPLGSTTTPV